MKGIIIYEKSSAVYNRSGIDIYFREAVKLGITLSLVYYENLSYGIHNNLLYVKSEGKLLQDVDFAINRCRDYRLAKHLESMRIRVFNNAKVNRIGNNKWETCEYYSGFHVPMPDTEFVPSYNLENYLKSCKDEIVVKAVHGHGGNQVCLFHPNNRDEIKQICMTMGSEDVVIQPFIPGKGQDLRVYVIGQSIIGAVLRTATNGFRSNYSLGGQVTSYKLTQKVVSQVEKIINCLPVDYVGIDFLIHENGDLLFNEIEDIVGARMLYQCTNIDVISLYMQYILRTLNKNYKHS